MGKLAVTGGEAIVKTDSDLAKLPIVSKEGISRAVELMEKGQLSVSPLVKEFEQTFARYVDAKYCLATNSGTNALHEALFAVGVGPGSEVIVPSFSWIFTAAPIIAAHGTPVFCDADVDTHCLNPEDVRKRISPRTRAIMVLHTWGNPANMDEILSIAREFDVSVVEDCAHAHGAMWGDEKVGILGDVGCFSLQVSKLLPGGEGGILVTSTREYYERAVALGHYERVRELPEDSEYKKYQTSLGFKHRVHPLAVVIADTNMKYLDERNAIRNQNGKYLEKGLEDIECVIPQKVYPRGKKQYSYHYGRYDETKLEGISLATFLKALRAEGVRVGVGGYGYLHEKPLFTEKIPYGNGCPGKCPHFTGEYTTEPADLPDTVYLREHVFTMAPRFEKPCKELLDQYVEAYHKVAGSPGELRKYEEENKPDLSDLAKGGTSLNLLS